MKDDNKKENKLPYELVTLDRKNLDNLLKKIDDYYRKNGRTIVGE